MPGITSHNDISYIGPVQATVLVNDPETLTVNWNTPQEIVDQGLAGYQLAITSQCFTDAQPTQAMVFNIQPDDPTSQQIVGLREYC